MWNSAGLRYDKVSRRLFSSDEASLKANSSVNGREMSHKSNKSETVGSGTICSMVFQPPLNIVSAR